MSETLQRAPLMEHLDVEALPVGTISRFFVGLVHDELGRSIGVPVMVARGRRPGPTFGITAAVHGNELNGIGVIHRLMEGLDLRSLVGSLAAVVVVNLPGYRRRQRKFLDGRDLNHLMPGLEVGHRSEMYARRFMERIARHVDYLVDLHTASFGRVNTLYVRADMTETVAARMAYLQRPRIILHNPPSDSTLRGAVTALGIPSITVEIGDPHRFQPEFIRRSLAGLRAVLSELGFTPNRKRKDLGPEPILCSRSYWMHTDSGGLLEVFPEVAGRVEQGEPVARLLNIFGDVVREYRAPESGVVIGKCVDPVAMTGTRILHLGIEARPEDLPFHARR